MTEEMAEGHEEAQDPNAPSAPDYEQIPAGLADAPPEHERGPQKPSEDPEA